MSGEEEHAEPQETLDQVQASAMLAKARLDSVHIAGVGCMVDTADHLHVSLVPQTKQSPHAVMLMMHGEDEESALTVFASPFTARVLASVLLNAADTLDDTTPLIFMPDCARPCCDTDDEENPDNVPD